MEKREIYEMMKMRVEVLVVEKKWKYKEIEGKDIWEFKMRIMEGEKIEEEMSVMKKEGEK